MFNKLTPAFIRSLAVFIVILVVSIIVVSISYVYMDVVYQDQQSAKRAMRIWQTKINSSVENNQIIDEFETNFLNLVNQGVVGAEDRLSWFETIQNTAKKRGMPSVKYSISTQELLKEPNLKREYKGIDVFKSVMTLDIKMAHEGDLFALLNDLRKADGLFAIDRCDIEKASKKAVDSDNNMKAYCELGWYTFRSTRAGKDNKNAS
jgi:cell division protein FtsI/penicillin-binding protein 2